MTEPNNYVSPNTSISLLLGTGEECNKTKPPSVSHLSNEHLEGLYIVITKERKKRKLGNKEKDLFNTVQELTKKWHEGNEHNEVRYFSEGLNQTVKPADINQKDLEEIKGTLLDIGLEQGTTDNETNYIDQSWMKETN
tara:strand:+ start:1238 stop:1651 length:414 start_codon:yes stop_codon:yes gene_type:complete